MEEFGEMAICLPYQSSRSRADVLERKNVIEFPAS
jgi:hypothetical protein